MTAFSEQKTERKFSRNPCGSTGKSNPNGPGKQNPNGHGQGSKDPK
jgi:hypothetical protein